MIPRDFITEWRREAPWVEDCQVEQDLVISRALVEIFSHPLLKTAVAFRGGTALYKLHILPPARYSEDIDLVQVNAGPAGPIMDALRTIFDPWLGEPRRNQNEGRVTLIYRFRSEDTPPIPLRLKVEMNSREHFSHFGIQRMPFALSSRWFSGTCEIGTYTLEELLGTKLRALYQRKKGRDLFDLQTGLAVDGVNANQIVETFLDYMARSGHQITRALFERNIADKMRDPQFTSDISPLLAAGYSWNIQTAAEIVSHALICLLPGDPWKGVVE
jgi:predicted nucleotidyltransferase component of viral defense system